MGSKACRSVSVARIQDFRIIDRDGDSNLLVMVLRWTYGIPEFCMKDYYF